MKKILFTFLAFTGTAFSSTLQVNSENKNIQQKKESIGHWTVSGAAQYQNQDLKSPVIQLLLGYQSAAERSQFFQAQKIEVGGGISLNTDNGFWYFPKITGIHYLNFDSNTRYYFNLGGAIAGRYYRGPEVKNEWGTYRRSEGGVFLMGSAGIGMEMGELNGTISALELSMDQPAAYYGKDLRQSSDYYPTAKISYIVGF